MNKNRRAEDRHEQILRMALDAARGRRRRRMLRRIVPLALVITLIGIKLTRLHLQDVSQVAVTPASRPSAPLASGFGNIRVTFIQTDPADYQRMSASHAPIVCHFIADHELLQALAMAGRPSGLIEMNGKMQILEHEPPRVHPL